MFGGARGSSTQYDIRDDTYLFKIQEQMWMKLNRKKFFNLASGIIPCARAAHTSVSIDNNRLVIYGGAILGKNIKTYLKKN